MSDRWVQVVGTYDSENATGQISALQPAVQTYAPAPPDKSNLSLAVLDETEKVLSEVPVEPEFGSCDDEVKIATFQAFVEAPDAAHSLSLRLAGKEINRFVASQPEHSDTELFGLGPQADHTIPVVSQSPADPNATYTLQARPSGDSIWQTVDIGLAEPSAASVDVNQFPGAKAIEVRVLKSKGFGSVEINREEIKFEK